jgi:bifunctional UDP-N-acetylglucosamine pyrophosphorylase/glucosamine-1-phosphate N-acetyltransferase
MAKNIKTIILAAGAGTRMKSDLPKVLHQIAGRPLLRFVLDNAKALGLRDVNVVVGFRKDLVCRQLDKNIRTVEQRRLLGTADALKVAVAKFKSFRGHLLVLYGDNPLIEKGSLDNLIKRHTSSDADCTILTAMVNNPFGYGRVVRDNYSRVKRKCGGLLF